jgi:TonB family protein
MARRRSTSPLRLVVALLVALTSHVVVGWLLVIYGLVSLWSSHPIDAAPAAQVASAGGEGTGDDRPIEIEQLVDELREPDRASDEEKKREEEKKKEEEDKDAKGQVVDIPRPLVEEHPDERARFLAEYDSKVARETRGKVGKDRAGAHDEVVGAQAPRQAVPPSGNPSALPGRPGLAMMHPRAVTPGMQGQMGSAEEIEEGGSQRRPGAPGQAAVPSTRRDRGGEGGIPGTRGAAHPNLQPSEEILQRAISKGGGSPDYLHDVDDGESTALNAKKFKYASFFNRVKRAVAEEWHPDVVYLRHDPSGNVYGNKDRVTVLRVHLKPDGKLQAATMMQSCGVEFLDDEAIDAFRRSLPFVNPPPQLVDADGLIHFNFGFIFELSGRTGFRVFKYQ